MDPKAWKSWIITEAEGMTRTPIHPGEILRDELAEMGMSANALAVALHVPANRISQILKSRRAITADTALRLARFFGTGADFWLNLQKAYELRLAERQSGREIRKTVSPRKAIRAA